MRRYVWIILLMTTTASLADRAADEATWDRLKLTRARDLSTSVALVAGGQPAAAIVPGEGQPWAAAARELRAAIATATGVELPILPAAAIGDAEWAERNLIVVGNLLTNPVYARLYHNYFVCADAAYTGQSGYELRTVPDPWGTGHSALALGAQAEEGLARGAARLGELITAAGRPGELALGRLLEVEFDRQGRRAPVPARLTAADIAAQQKRIDGVYAQVGTERSAAHQTVDFGMMYHRTGDEGWLELYRYGLERHLDYYATNEYINEEGPRRYDRDFRDSWAYGFVVAWDLVEEAPGWTDAERLAITNHVLRLVWETNLYQNWDNPAAIEGWRTFDSITHNHHTWPGLADLFGGWYFQRHYQLPIADDWLTIALGMFRSIARSSKPWEDSAGYQWIPLRHVLMYSFAAGDPTFVAEGHAARAGRVALMTLDPLGDQPAWGDHSAFTGASALPELYSMLEYATGDGRYRWALERLGDDGRGELEEPHWTAVAPVRPDDLVGVAASYLPKIHYDLLGSNRDYFQSPNLPWAETFDKLTLREGWDPEDEYLLLDGYAGGSHGHLDANSIIGYTAHGTHWLVDGEYIRRIPKYHNAVTVLKEGRGSVMPPNTRLDAAVWFGDGGLSRTTMPHHNGVSWTRNLVFLPGRYVAAIDEVTAETAGDYSLRCSWRILGETRLDGQGITAQQLDQGFRPVNLSGDALELLRIKEYGSLPAYQLYQRRFARLAAGETVRFVNVFRAAPGPPPTVDAVRLGDGRFAIGAGAATEIVGVDGFAGEGLATDAALYRLTADEAWLVDATELTVGAERRSFGAGPRTVRVGGKVVEAVAAPVPEADLRPTATVPAATGSLALGERLAALAKPAPAAGQTVVAAAGEPLRQLWRCADFPLTPVAIQPVAIRASVAPQKKYLPLERLLDGHYSSSTGSCLFPAGEIVEIVVDLGAPKQITGVQVRAWEMNEGWQTASITAAVSRDDFAADSRPLGPLTVAGEQRWGSNVNTIYRANAPAASARYVKVTAVPKTPEAAVYLAEIELFGGETTGTAELLTIAAGDLAGDGRQRTLVGTGGGEVVALDAAGAKLWEVEVDGAVGALAVAPLDPSGRLTVIYGTEGGTLGLIAADGTKLKEVQPPPYRGIPSRVKTISVADLRGDGVPEIVIGVESWQYLAYTPELELIWKNVIYAHSATVGHVADLDGDGQLETIAGNAYYRLHITSATGKTWRQGGRFGPEQTAVTAGDLDGDGKLEAILGTDDGTVIAFAATGEQRFSVDLGDRITSLLVREIAGRPAVLAASESGYVWALDGGGAPLWQTPVGGPVKRLLNDGERLLAAADDVVELNLAGEVTAVGETPAAAVGLAIAGEQVVALLADGTAAAFEVR